MQSNVRPVESTTSVVRVRFKSASLQLDKGQTKMEVETGQQGSYVSQNSTTLLKAIFVYIFFNLIDHTICIYLMTAVCYCITQAAWLAMYMSNVVCSTVLFLV